MIDTLPHQQIACFAGIFGLSTRWSASGRHWCGAGHTCSTSSWIGTRKSPPTTWRQWVRPHRSSPTSPGSPPWSFAEPVVAMLEASGCTFSTLSLHIPICYLFTNYRVTPSVLTTQQYATRDPLLPTPKTIYPPLGLLHLLKSILLLRAISPRSKVGWNGECAACRTRPEQEAVQRTRQKSGDARA